MVTHRQTHAVQNAYSKKLGLHKVDLKVITKTILVSIWVELSLSKEQHAWPNVKRAKTFYCSGAAGSCHWLYIACLNNYVFVADNYESCVGVKGYCSWIASAHSHFRRARKWYTGIELSIIQIGLNVGKFAQWIKLCVNGEEVVQLATQ